jgi:UDP-4-amino-4,6-dideoxy-N-acetyl-beta-L-altrosamine N-acetyltransferase
MNMPDDKSIAHKLRRDFEFESYSIINYINLSDAEIEMVRTWRNHETIREVGYTEHNISSAEHKDFFRKLKSDDHNFYWVMKENDKCLGALHIVRVDSKHRNGYLGLYMNPYIHKPGIGTLLIKYLIKLSFEIAKLHALKLETIEGNIPAIKLFNKMGFKEEGRLKEFVYKDGKWKDVLVMGITNKESQ